MRIRVIGQKDIEIGEENGRALLALLREQGIYADAPCGGRGSCGKCLVQFLSGAPFPTEEERLHLTAGQLADGFRLACCTVPGTDAVIRLSTSSTEQMRVETGFRRQTGGMGETGGGGMGDDADGLGVAVDIGTTTIAIMLIRLRDGVCLGTETMVNHQRMYGADVISRIQAACEGRAELLKNLVRRDLSEGIAALLEKYAGGVSLKRVVIAGNTTMCHLLCGYSCEKLGVAPFIPENISLQEYKMPGDSDVQVTILPGISAFVGADIVAGILACGMDQSDELTMLVDMGTNSEMVIGNRNGFLVTSAAAGPAFEGGCIRCGMPGVAGAICHVELQETPVQKANAASADARVPSGVRAEYETIGGGKPEGICGTGIVDVMYGLVRQGLVDENGTLAEPFFAGGFPIAKVGERQIRLTQEDIREIQLAKSAIRAGLETLIREYGTDASAIKQVYLAGGFGQTMDTESAAGIGLLPPELKDRVVPIGNAALRGACDTLCAGTSEVLGFRERLLHIVRTSREINLAMHPEFNELYLQYMFF